MMKASELMIWDLVRMRRCDVPNATFYTSNVLCLQKDGFLEYEPIPLTEEILKANNLGIGKFELKKENQGCVQVDTTRINIHVSTDNTRIAYHVRIIHKEMAVEEGADIFIKIHYVHELQHALRLCGLNDLADNFKLK